MGRWIALVGVLLSGCDEPNIVTEERQLGLRADGLGSFWSGDPVLAGSNVCLQYEEVRTGPEVDAFAEEASGDVASCYDLRTSDGGQLEGMCISLPTPGVTTLSFERRDCDVSGSFGSDELRFDVVPFADVAGTLPYSIPADADLLRYAQLYDVELELLAPAIDQPGVVALAGEPAYIVEGGAQHIRGEVVLAQTGQAVAVPDASAVASAIAGDPEFYESDDPTALVEYDAVAGDVFGVSVAVPGGIVDAGDVHVVAASDIASIEIFPAVLRVSGSDRFLRLGADVVARDAAGRVLREPPMRWSKLAGSGNLSMVDADGDGEADPGPAASLDDVCEGAVAGEQRSALLEGAVNGLTDTVEVTWECAEGQDEGCSCRSSGGGQRAWLLVLLLVAVVRRRR